MIEEDHTACFIAIAPSGFIKRDRFSSPAEVEASVEIFSLTFDLGGRRLHLEKIGSKHNTLTQEQANYISVPIEGPFQPDHYRY